MSSRWKTDLFSSLRQSASLAKEMLISSEMNDLADTLGSYDQASLPNITVVPSSKHNFSSETAF